jgi:hypothetical protein
MCYFLGVVAVIYDLSPPYIDGVLTFQKYKYYWLLCMFV